MKILDIEERGEMIVVTTDNESRPEFVYYKDKFSNYMELKNEIEKSISLENKRKIKKVIKYNSIIAGFEEEKLEEEEK